MVSRRTRSSKKSPNCNRAVVVFRGRDAKVRRMSICIRQRQSRTRFHPERGVWKAALERKLEVPSAEVPRDLRVWVSPDILLEWIQDEVTATEQEHEMSSLGAARINLFPKVLAGVLCYSYACDILSSAEVVMACRSDNGLRRIAKGKTYFENEISHFRRAHRPMLLRFLARVFARTLAWEKNISRVNLDSGLLGSVIRQAQERLDTARHLDVC